MSRDARASLPSVDRLISSPEGTVLVERYGHSVLVDAARAVLADARERFSDEGRARPDAPMLAAQCAERIEGLMRPSLRPVFNLTGTVLHTNLGRALYAQEAID